MSNRKAIVLAGGRGTRMYPMTAVQSKQLIPVYDKPMIFYALTTVMLSGIREILIISGPEEVVRFQRLMGDGSQWGILLRYAVQDEPRGIADALVVGAGFLNSSPSLLMLGDNVFYGQLDFLRAATKEDGDDAIVFAHQVSNPSDYGVVEFDDDGRVVSLEEKPIEPRSRWAVPGLYLYPRDAAAQVANLKPSARGELEITDLNRRYLDQERLTVRIMGRGIAWFDTGTPQSLLAASNFVEAVESRQGLIIGSPEEVAYRMQHIDRGDLASLAAALPTSTYRTYLEEIASEPSMYRIDSDAHTRRDTHRQ